MWRKDQCYFGSTSLPVTTHFYVEYHEAFFWQFPHFLTYMSTVWDRLAMSMLRSCRHHNLTDVGEGLRCSVGQVEVTVTRGVPLWGGFQQWLMVTGWGAIYSHDNRVTAVTWPTDVNRYQQITCRGSQEHTGVTCGGYPYVIGQDSVILMGPGYMIPSSASHHHLNCISVICHMIPQDHNIWFICPPSCVIFFHPA